MHAHQALYTAAPLANGKFQATVTLKKPSWREMGFVWIEPDVLENPKARQAFSPYQEACRREAVCLTRLLSVPTRRFDPPAHETSPTATGQEINWSSSLC